MASTSPALQRRSGARKKRRGGGSSIPSNALDKEACCELFDCLPQPGWIVDSRSLKILRVNAEGIQHYGFSSDEFLKMRLTDLLVGSNEEKTRLLQATARPGKGSRLFGQWKHRRKSLPSIQVELTWTPVAFAQQAAALVLSTDVTSRLHSEKTSSVFTQLGRKLGSARTPKQAASSIIDAADMLFGWNACLFALCTPDQSRLTTVLAVDTFKGERLEVVTDEDQPGPITREALRSGPRLILRGDDETPAECLRFGDKHRLSRSIMAVPVGKLGEVVGVLTVQSYLSNAYTDEDLLTLNALAEQCAGALDRIRAEQEIDRLHREVRGHLEELKTLFDVAPVGIAVAHDKECRCVSVNTACRKLLDLTSEESSASVQFNDAILPFRIVKEGREMPADELPIRRAAQQGMTISGDELDIILPGGKCVSCYCCASPLFDESGAVRGSIGIFVDLTSKRAADQEILRLNSELERRVHDRTYQLELINKELEAFSYSVSHDLRAPLRSIRGFSEVLLERYGQRLDLRGQEFLRRACESCAQMDKLIEDLLKLSRVNRSELQNMEVDLSQIARSISAELQLAEPSRHVEFQIETGLVARGG